MDPLRVMVVDDNPTFLRAATRFLGDSEGITVVGALLRGEDALTSLEALHPDVALVDLAMPELPGLEIIPRLRKARPDVGIIALTLLDARSYRDAALAAGADDFVAKATLSTDLVPTIRRVAETRRGMENA